jgi:hypothetical protein
MRHSMNMLGKTLCLITGLFLCLAVTTAASALYMGQDKESVRQELGEPNGKRVLSDGEMWVYSGDIALTFTEGRLASARGVTLTLPPDTESHSEAGVSEPGSAAPEPSGPAEPGPLPEEGEPESPSRPPEPAGSELDREIEQFSQDLTDPETLERMMAEAGRDSGAEAGEGLVSVLMKALAGIILLFFFLLMAFKWVGAEAARTALFLIATVDRLVVVGVQWIFLDLLGFPMTFYADSLASFLVVLVLVTRLTHARSLPTAIKVVVASKVAALVATYLLAMVLLFNMG